MAEGLEQGMILDPHLPLHHEFIRNCPIIANIILSNQGSWPTASILLFKRIVQKCKAPFTVPDANPHAPAHASNLAFWQEGHWFPHWPLLRQGKKYSNFFTTVPEPVAGEWCVQMCSDRSACSRVPLGVM